METQPILITGAAGKLGQACQHVCHIRGLHTVALPHTDLDIADPEALALALRRYQPWAVVNAAGCVSIDAAEADAARCYRANTLGPSRLAAACAAHGAQLLTFSCDLVFDGQRASPYREHDAARPLNVYGHSKLLAEQAVLECLPSALVVRTSSFFSAWDEHSFVNQALTAARQGDVFAAADDLVISPTYLPDLLNTALDLLLDGAHGRWHLANQGACTWAELARQTLCLAGLDEAYVQGRPAASFGWAAQRPHYSALGSHYGALLPSIESGLRRHLLDEQAAQTTQAALLAA
jgi:dTDP-4-dehydrorhamnose reductase